MGGVCFFHGLPEHFFTVVQIFQSSSGIFWNIYRSTELWKNCSLKDLWIQTTCPYLSLLTLPLHSFTCPLKPCLPFQSYYSGSLFIRLPNNQPVQVSRLCPRWSQMIKSKSIPCIQPWPFSHFPPHSCLVFSLLSRPSVHIWGSAVNGFSFYVF